MFISSKILAVVAVVFVSGSIAAPVPRRAVSDPLAHRDLGIDLATHFASDNSGKESPNDANVLGASTGAGVGPLSSDPVLPMEKVSTEGKAYNPILVSRTETGLESDWYPARPSKDPHIDGESFGAIDANAGATFSK